MSRYLSWRCLALDFYCHQIIPAGLNAAVSCVYFPVFNGEKRII
ncbi:hypothetical protein B194_2435 [Serratia plymuthica A30]|nr:hypothetical protein B194_2435 [Serratia plymuthica A30]